MQFFLQENQKLFFFVKDSFFLPTNYGPGIILYKCPKYVIASSLSGLVDVGLQTSTGPQTTHAMPPPTIQLNKNSDFECNTRSN